MAATSYYRSQKKACSKYFKSAKNNAVTKNEPIVRETDITGRSAHEVVRLLKSVVNNKLAVYHEDSSVFELKIKPPNLHSAGDSASRFFRLCPKPTDDQPGNGTICYIETWCDNKADKEKVHHTVEAKHSFKDLNDLLTKTYTCTLDTCACPTCNKTGEEKTHHFARDIKKAFKNNEEIYNVPSATAEAYMLLLFEIGRRLKKGSQSPYDKLPIASAMVKLVTTGN